MKKTTLYKLVKQALYEVYKEKRGGILKGSNKLLDKISLSERAQLNKDLMRKEDIKKGLLREQQELNNAEELYNFLVKNSEAGVPLEEIADDPLLKGINIDGLGAIYKILGTINFEQFLELSKEFLNPPTVTCSCATATTNSCPNYGTMQIWTNDCSPQPIEIDDFFICCS